MKLLRIYAPLGESPLRCEWVLLDGPRATGGETSLSELPRGTARVQLVIPAAHVLITRATLPPGARQGDAAVLAFAVEEASAVEPEANLVSWLGGDCYAVLDRKRLGLWRAALEAAGVRGCEIHAESLLVPLASGEWSLAWNGAEGFVRSGEFEGAATDRGDAAAPPLALRMMLEQGPRPAAIAVYAAADQAPDLKLWEAALGVPLRLTEPWDWRSAPIAAGGGLAPERKRWRFNTTALAPLRPAGWIAAAALAIHAAALLVDWTRLAAEQRGLRAQMETRFRAAFPNAAVVDPALQMRRQLAAARHRAGVPDGGDFAPMMQKVGSGLKELPAGSVRAVSYESGRITLELAAADVTALRAAAARLAQAGLLVDVTGAKVITVRSP
jgi:general secretion pathway protein L